MTDASPFRALLEVEDPTARRAAIKKVYRLEGDDDEVDALVFTLLGDVDPGVRHATVDLIRRTGLTQGVGNALARSIRDEMLARRASAVDACGRLGGSAVGLLITLLDEDREGLRRLAVDALGLTGTGAAAQPLLRAFDDESPAVRAAALEGYARVDPQGAPEALRTFVGRTDEPSSVMLSALLTLETLGVRLDADELVGHARDPMCAVPALRLLGRAGAAGVLIDAITRHRGSRLRAALAGLVFAFAEDKSAVARAVTSKTLVLDEVQALLSGHDRAAAEGALVIGALLGRADWFAIAAQRGDRAQMLSLAHAAARELRRPKPAQALEEEADRVSEADVAHYLRELAQEVATAKAPAPPPRRHQPSLKDVEFDRLARLLLSRAGLQFDRQAAYRLESRLINRVHAQNLDSFSDYLELIESPSVQGRSELGIALERVTVHETYFFREMPQLEAFSGAVARQLAKDTKDRPARVWSAGCSTGEEAWTIAILLSESGLFSESSFEVVGTDIARGVLETAQKGVYSERCFRGDMSGAQRRRWFEPTDEGRRVNDQLRRHVSFRQMNLTEDDNVAELGRFDVIFCRNVLIYLSRDARLKLIARFYERLHPGGVLLLGHSESLLSLETPFAFAPIGKELVYIRRSEHPPGRLGDHFAGGGS